jgi:hypothetical protein
VIPVGDSEKHLIAIPAGHPDGWEGVNEACMAELDKAREQLHDADEIPDERRGAFFTLGTGVSFGGGQTHPMNFSNKGLKGKVAEHLNRQPCFR